MNLTMSGKAVNSIGRLSRKTFPIMLLVGALVVAVAGANAAEVPGDISAEQPLLVSGVSFPESDGNWSDASGTVRGVRGSTIQHHVEPARSIAGMSADRSQFRAAAEIYQGDTYLVQVCFANKGGQNLVARLDIDLPTGLAIDVFGGDEESASGEDGVTNVTRVGTSTWEFYLAAGADGSGIVTNADSENAGGPWANCIGIGVSSSIAIPPGNYPMIARIEQVAYVAPPAPGINVPPDVESQSFYEPGSECEQLELSLINQSRDQFGLPPLVMDDALQRFARAYATDMASRDFFSHTDPDGRSFADRLSNAEVRYQIASENLGYGYGSCANVVLANHQTMIAQTPPNDGHRRNILQSQVQKVGIGLAQRLSDGKVYYASEFSD